MNKLILNYLIDRSDTNRSRYSLRCPTCRQTWNSTPEAPVEGETVADRKARAAAEALEQFDLCPLCCSLVCTDCITEVWKMKMCRQCADRIAESA